MPPPGKYHIPETEKDMEILPNLLNITDKVNLIKSEIEGFYKAKIILINELQSDTVFDLKYIFGIHELALKHLYKFAGKLRTVNISKEGFLFPAAKFLPEILDKFERKILLKLPPEYNSRDELIKDIAIVHAELLFIHPFREGNGRLARMLADLMALKQEYDLLKFYKINRNNFRDYVIAVQKAADKDYSYMEQIIRILF